MTMVDIDAVIGAALDEAGALARAVALARRNGTAGQLPFAALVIRDGTVIGAGVNPALADHDPSAHGEVTAVRDAARRLGTLDLAGAVSPGITRKSSSTGCWAELDSPTLTDSRTTAASVWRAVAGISSRRAVKAALPEASPNIGAAAAAAAGTRKAHTSSRDQARFDIPPRTAAAVSRSGATLCKLSDGHPSHEPVK